MENQRNRMPKYHYNGSKAECRKEQQTSDKSEADDALRKLEMKIDAGAAHMGLVIADIFTFLTKSAAMLPDMELHTELLDLTVDDSGISAHIKYPDNSGENNADYDDEEEELLYDGD